MSVTWCGFCLVLEKAFAPIANIRWNMLMGRSRNNQGCHCLWGIQPKVSKTILGYLCHRTTGFLVQEWHHWTLLRHSLSPTMVALLPCSLRNLHYCMGLASLPLRALRLPRFHRPTSRALRPLPSCRLVLQPGPLESISGMAMRFLRAWLSHLHHLFKRMAGAAGVLLLLLVRLLSLLPDHSGRVRPCGKVPLWILGALRRHHQPVGRPRARGDHQPVVPPFLVLTCPWGT